MRKHTLLGLTLAAALAIGTTAVMAATGGGPEPFGDDGWHGHHGHHGHGQMRMLAKLNLSDAQEASIKELVSAARERNKASREALRKQRRAFESMTPDQAGYEAAATSLAQAEGQAAQARVQQQAKLRAQIHAMLTPEQQAQAATLKAQAQARRQQWQQFKAEHPQPAAQ